MALVLGLALTLIGLGYFVHHWAYGRWSYQRRHVSLSQVYQLFVEKHESELQARLRHAGPDHRCELCNPAGGEVPPFVLTRDRDIARVRRRIALLRSETEWQDWLAGPWRTRTGPGSAGADAAPPIVSGDPPRTNPDSPLPRAGGGPVPASIGEMRAAPRASSPATGRGGGPSAPSPGEPDRSDP